jgi:Protein of unknown function (DUF2934)
MDLHDLIAQAACELFMKSGRITGHDMENWLQAEWYVKNRYRTVDDLAEFPEAD